MFTGIVEEIGALRRVDATGSGARLEIECAHILDRLGIGDSVSVSGVCLTVTDRAERGFTVDVVPETLARTTIRHARPGTRVNLERAPTLTTVLGGHLVQGHVDTMIELLERAALGDGARLVFGLPAGTARYVAEKGSVAVDGVSLTVAAVTLNAFTVALIPHTAERTTLGSLAVGQPANLEVDIIAKYVERLLPTK